jgi:hypothetical protein
MGDGVTGSVNAPVNQTTNARNSASPADTAARLEFGKALEQQNICPEGLGRPSRHDPPCSYLRNPSQPPQPSQPVDIHYKGNPDHLKGPMNGSNSGADYSKPIPQRPSNSLKPPEGPYHTGGLGTGDGAHIVGYERKI